MVMMIIRVMNLRRLYMVIKVGVKDDSRRCIMYAIENEDVCCEIRLVVKQSSIENSFEDSSENLSENHIYNSCSVHY